MAFANGFLQHRIHFTAVRWWCSLCIVCVSVHYLCSVYRIKYKYLWVISIIKENEIFLLSDIVIWVRKVCSSEIHSLDVNRWILKNGPPKRLLILNTDTDQRNNCRLIKSIYTGFRNEWIKVSLRISRAKWKWKVHSAY